MGEVIKLLCKAQVKDSRGDTNRVLQKKEKDHLAKLKRRKKQQEKLKLAKESGNDSSNTKKKKKKKKHKN